jgi:hypothetical protein
MKFSSAKNILTLSAGLFVAACATTTGVLPKGDGVYTINVAQGDASKVKLRAYQHAEKFCAEKSANGIEVVKENLRPDALSGASAIIDLDFRCKGPVNSDYGKKVMKEVQKEEEKKAKKAAAQ